MLHFWYSERCSREIKLIVSISTCLMIYLAAKTQQLSPIFVGISLAMGVSIHFIYKFSLKLKTSNHSLRLKMSCILILVLLIVVLIYALPKMHQMLLAIQSLGFIALGLFMTSIYAERAKRHP